MILSMLPETFEQSGYHFQKLRQGDLRLIRYWLMEPHVADWWTPAESEIRIMEKEMRDPRANVLRYIVSHGDRDFAYIQVYDPAGDEEFWGENPQGPGTFGIDQFIGDPQMIGFGHGTNFIKAFVAELKTQDEVKRIIADPAPDNVPAIRCFSQVGFRKEKEIVTPDGPALLMSITKDA
jgi:aminoglycoside 6'-N-acetyltransferase